MGDLRGSNARRVLRERTGGNGLARREQDPK